MFSDGGCSGCFQSQKGVAREIERVRTEAKEFAKENKVVVAIYQETPFNFGFIKAELAGGLNVIDRVTPY